MFEPGKAQEVGLIDSVLGRDEFFREAAAEAGLDPDETRVVAPRQPTALEALFGVRRSFGTSLPLAEAGDTAVVSANFCGGATPLVFSGDLAAVCG